MSIATVVTGGFGSFGSVNNIPTYGFTIGLVSVPTVPGLEYTMPRNCLGFIMSENLTHYTADTDRLHYRTEDEDL